MRLESPFYGRTADKYAIWPSYDEDYGKWNNYRENFEYTDSNGNKQSSTVYLNGYAMVRDKTALTLQEDLGGIMIFNSSCDISYESRYALHRAVNEVIEQRIPAEYRRIAREPIGGELYRCLPVSWQLGAISSFPFIPTG